MSAPRTVLITGASGGVGRGIAIACGEAGWEVWVAARRAEQRQTVAAEVDAAGGVGRHIACDVGDPASVDSVIDEIRRTSGQLHGVVHNATSGYSAKAGLLSEVPMSEFEDQVAVSLRGTFLFAKAAEPMLSEAGGAFVVMTSEAGFEGKKLLGAYAYVKAAERGLMRSLAREWGPKGIRVNAVAPLAMTPAMEDAFELDPTMSERVAARNPLRRMGDTVRDIGPAVRFLLGDDARYVAAQTLMVDGGSSPIT